MGHHHKVVEDKPELPDSARVITLPDIKDQTYDYIIIGGGTSGCLLASRLASAKNHDSATHRFKVLLVEAGGEAEEDPENLIPGLVVPKFGSEAGNWLYQTAPQKELNNRTIVYPRGRGMGGSSANNFSSWVRGPKCDWDDWADVVGDDWWRWDNVVEYIKVLEDFHPEVPRGMEKYVEFVEGMHHRGGPIGVGTGAEWQQVVEYCLQGAMEVGHELNKDHNDGHEMGISVAQMNVDRGVRRSAAAAFLGREARGAMDNLHVVTRSLCNRVVFDANKVIGVELIPAKPGVGGGNDEVVRVNVNKEVVLSAGTFETPHVLMLSGTGPAAELSRHNIDIVHDLPHVGQNIRDHCAFSIEAVIDPTIKGHNQLLHDPEALEKARTKYTTTQTGPLAVFGASAAMLFARIPELYQSPEFTALPSNLRTFLSNPNRPSTELWLHGGPLFYQGNSIGPKDSVIAIEGLCQNLLSKGSLSLASAAPRDLPLIDPAYCTEPYDWRIVIETVKVQLRIADSPAIKAITRKVVHGPGKKHSDGSVTLCSPNDENAIKDFLREELTQGFHSMGSCVMGNEAHRERFVDSEFRVLGVEGLRVCDMSVCPILTNNHTQINAYMIGERCAQVMLAEL